MGIYMKFKLLLPGLTICIGAVFISHTNDIDAPSPEMVFVEGGTFSHLYNVDSQKTTVQPFNIDKYPVTNEEFWYFAYNNPQWQRGNVKPIFADQGYLKHWPSGLGDPKNLGQLRNKPVVNISWFAAKKYCECQGKRLPTVDEWEFLALASETRPDGAEDPGFYQQILDWYSKPSGMALDTVGSTFRNYYGVWDMYGLVWEWVLDFNTAMISGESRGDTGLNRDLFCGSGSAGASDPGNYVAFMRYAFRASLKANYSVQNLGFRCAKDGEGHAP